MILKLLLHLRLHQLQQEMKQLLLHLKATPTTTGDETAVTTPEATPTTTEDETAAAEQTSDDPYVVNSTNTGRHFQIHYDDNHVVTSITVTSDSGNLLNYVLENQIEANGLYVVSTKDLINWDNISDQTIVLMRYDANANFVKDRIMEIELVHVPAASIRAEGVMTVAEGKITEESIDTINGAVVTRALLQFGPIEHGNPPSGVDVDVVQGTTNTLGCSRSEGSGENCLFAERDAYVTISEEAWLTRDESENEEDFDEKKHLGYRAFMNVKLVPRENAKNTIHLFHEVVATRDNTPEVRDSFRDDIYLSTDAIEFESTDIAGDYTVRLVRKDIRDMFLNFAFELHKEEDESSSNTDTFTGISFELERFVAPPTEPTTTTTTTQPAAGDEPKQQPTADETKAPADETKAPPETDDDSR